MKSILIRCDFCKSADVITIYLDNPLTVKPDSDPRNKTEAFVCKECGKITIGE